MNTNVDFLNSIDWNNHDGVNLPMINDFMRNQFYDNVLQDNVKDKHCLDIGFGTGLLTILALKHGAKFITAYESDRNRYLLGCEIIKRLRLENKITLIHQRYNCNEFDRHNADVIFSETVNGGLWNEGLWESLPRHVGVQFLPGKYYLDILAVEISESFATGLINKIDNQQYFSPGVDMDPLFIECVNSLSNRKNNANINLCADGITQLSNIDTVWGRMPYMRLAAYNGKSMAGYTIDAIENTITITDRMGTSSALINFATREFQMHIDTSEWTNKCMLLIPRVGMKHGNENLILDTGHWGPTEYPVVIKNTQNSTIKISHNILSGIITYG
jgi:hypothetical protein